MIYDIKQPFITSAKGGSVYLQLVCVCLYAGLRQKTQTTFRSVQHRPGTNTLYFGADSSKIEKKWLYLHKCFWRSHFSPSARLSTGLLNSYLLLSRNPDGRLAVRDATAPPAIQNKPAKSNNSLDKPLWLSKALRARGTPPQAANVQS